MPYTRRDLMRDASLATAAGVTGSSLSLLEGCRSKTPAPVVIQPVKPQVTPPLFDSGVRLFFEGAWLFCADPTNPKTMMRAVSFDMVANQHYFRYGLWSSPWNNSAAPQLPIWNPQSAPASVALTANPNPAADIDTLFGAAQTYSPFTYLWSAKPSTPNTINWNTALMRVVSMPIPTQIIPAAFRTDASLSDPKGHRHPLPGTCQDIGIATTHIFQYTGGDGLVFSLDPSTTVKASQDSTADYHFHAAPQSPLPDPAHAPAMFQAMLQLITRFPYQELTLLTPKDPSTMAVGPNVPACVLPAELGMTVSTPAPGGQVQPMYGDSPTCTAGGIGVGGNCC